MRDREPLEEAAAVAGDDREHPEVQLVDQPGGQQGEVGLAGPELEDVAALAAALSARTEATRSSPSSSCAFQVSSGRPREITRLGREFIRSAYQSPDRCDHDTEKPS